MPGVDGCRRGRGLSVERMPSAKVFMVEIPNLPVFELIMGGDGIICCACAMAFAGSTGGGRVDCESGDETGFGVMLDDFFLCNFLAVSATGSVSRGGDSCGDRSELISILKRYPEKVSQTKDWTTPVCVRRHVETH